MDEHFVLCKFDVALITTGYVSHSQASSNGTSESRPLNGEK